MPDSPATTKTAHQPRAIVLAAQGDNDGASN